MRSRFEEYGDAAMGLTPAERYRRELDLGHLTEDDAQRRAAALLDDLHHRLESRQSRRRWRIWRRSAAPVAGLYLWGEVGRGKTLLMDLFHDSLSVGRLRMHFHRFMRRVHDDLHRLRGTSDPLRRVADGLAERARVLCFDEFFVSDIGDAMILGELLKNLFDRGVTLVATSNVQPSRLYENGLQRRRFLPAIAALEKHTLVHRMDGSVDHRLRTLERAEIYHWPLDTEAERSLAASFAALAGGRSQSSADSSGYVAAHREYPDSTDPGVSGAVQLEINGRSLTARQLADDVAWFEFAELCEGPRSANDYIELARCHNSVLLSNVRRFDSKREDAARRFISLIDEFYDRNVNLIISAQTSVEDLYAGERYRREFQRTASRLVEMQSKEYLARAHRAG